MANSNDISLADRPLSHVGGTPDSVSGSADDRPVSRAIRAALIARGTSLRGWALAWAAAQGEPEIGAYATLRMTLRRRLDRGLAPHGERGGRMVRALRDELGAELVPEYPAVERRDAA